MRGPGLYGNNFFIIKDDKELIRENIIRVLLTSPGERVMSNFGCKLKDYLLNQSSILKQDVEDEIVKSIMRWENRVEVSDVRVELVEEHAARIQVFCKVKNTFNDFNLDTVIRF